MAAVPGRLRWAMAGWRALIFVACALAGLATLPHRYGRYRSLAHLDGLEASRALGRGVAGWIGDDLDVEQFSTGSRRFDGEWLFGTHVMAALGFGQLARADPHDQARHLARMDRALAALRRPALRRFDREAWGRDGLAALEDDRGHVALLGYWGLALALRRSLGPSEHDELERRVIDALTRRLEGRDGGLVETYPGERYPVDNAAGVAAVALHAQARGRSRPPAVAAWLADLPKWREPQSGLLIQAMGADGVTPVDAPRSSGTALAAYFLSFADRAVSRALYQALIRSAYEPVLGFGAVKEYPAGHQGAGDIDSGPLIFGYSISATGFALAGARIHDDRERFAGLYATAHLFGAPRARGGRIRFLTGGPLGDAILFAMLTAGEGR